MVALSFIWGSNLTQSICKYVCHLTRSSAQLTWSIHYSRLVMCQSQPSNQLSVSYRTAAKSFPWDAPFTHSSVAPLTPNIVIANYIFHGQPKRTSNGGYASSTLGPRFQ